jgi:hypothetical protein
MPACGVAASWGMGAAVGGGEPGWGRAGAVDGGVELGPGLRSGEEQVARTKQDDSAIETRRQECIRAER